MEDQVNQGSAASRGDKPGEHASGCNKVAGDGIDTIVVDTTMVAMRKGVERAIHQKAVRRTAAMFPGIGASEIDAVAIVILWCWKMERLGGPETSIVNWAGYTYNFKRRLKNGIRQAIDRGYLETLKVTSGERLCPTNKGERILAIYTSKFEELEQQIKDQKQNAKPKRRYPEAEENQRARQAIQV